MKIKFEGNNGSVVRSWTLNPSQEKFWISPKKFILFSGGFGCGKSLMLTLKAIEMALRYPKNYILMGRKTYPELRDTLWKEFFIHCPPEFINEPRKSEMVIPFKNGSEIIFRHLDTISESEIRSLNLGSAFIDQAEDIQKPVFLALMGRLRRDGIADEDRKIYLSCNPKLTWLYADFKQNPGTDYDLIEASTLENKENLPPAYIENLLSYPESWRRQYVEGVWDYSLLSDRVVFAREYIERLIGHIECPVETREGLEIYRTFVEGHRYQMGVDASEGTGGDEAAITIADITAMEEAASWSGHVPPDILGEYAARFARWYQTKNTRCLVIPEMNSMGIAVVNKLKREEDIRMYIREEFDKITGQKLKKFGWRTTSATKPLLASRFQERLRLQNPKIYAARTVEQFKSFVYTDEANKRGMGAETGFHDDRLFSALLAFWEKGPIIPATVSKKEEYPWPVPVRPTIEVKAGRIISISGFRPRLSIGGSWRR